ncbi:MAG: peptidoglycan DD-metalloendopeptidase family protein [Leptolyngbya sp. IPPAS B-1204]
MTSAMLRIYALPPAEASTPNPGTDPPSTDTVTNSGSTEPLPAVSVAAPEAAPPEVAPPNVTSTAPPAETLQPAAAPVQTIAPTATPVPTAPQASGIEKPTATPSLPKPAHPPAAATDPNVDSNLTDQPGATTNPVTPLPQANPKAGANANPQTIAGMRQVLEKRLAGIVEQDKATRESQWQQNVIYTALQAAWNKEFERARQIAKHPALPPALQLEVLTKIAAIEAQLTTQPSPQTAQASTPGQQPAGASRGRSVPSGYAGVNLASLSNHAGISLANQCPAVNHSVASAPNTNAKPGGSVAAAKSTQASGQPAGIPAFIPALGESLASRLVQLSQKPSGVASHQTSGKQEASTRARQPLVAPHLFTGVASSSVKPQLDQPAPAQVPQAPTQASTAQPLAPRPIPAQPTVAQPTAARPTAELASRPIADAKTQVQVKAEPEIPAPALLSASANDGTASAEALSSSPVNSGLDSWMASTLNYSLAQLNLPFLPPLSDFSSRKTTPLDLVRPWWLGADDKEPSNQPPAEANLADAAQASIQPARFGFEPLNLPSAEVGLSNAPLWQTLEQKLASLQPQPNLPKLAQKLSIPSLVAKPTTKPAVYDAASLLAISCSNAQLGHYDAGSYVVDPATSKQMGWVNLLFPLPIPAVITSAFGWRIHPISGNLSFHTGLDLGAPMGTPVMAALGGRVVAADYMGGYGLAVVVENPTTRQRNLYGHLSGIAVQPGMQVAQGAILGWVGSTGNSTGPHLHFESLISTETGWTAVDPLASAAVAVAKGDK